MKKRSNDRSQCPIRLTESLIGGRWKTIILWLLSKRSMRFNELRRELSGITQKVLTEQLRELEEDRLIHRKVYEIVPAKVEYSLSGQGERLIPIVVMMCSWGEEYLSQELAREKLPQENSQG
ncbi:winged helix-turn-helix transcriptional regulator [Cohnella faecalis]|uniref:Transcriptional regulator n=1 Tax=Cohnella faecalis TaxID=2315694 RepID=A0A398CQ51_9BACL|nr:helix-turn-helix domain-containing protein [Cohnella faecalis]RIE01104.1 transcriptional regulator [Cohnella faecalis]